MRCKKMFAGARNAPASRCTTPGPGTPASATPQNDWRAWKLGTSDHRQGQLAPCVPDGGRAAGLFRHPARPQPEHLRVQLRPGPGAHGRPFVDLQHRRRRQARRLQGARRQAAVRARHGRPDLLAARDDRLSPATCSRARCGHPRLRAAVPDPRHVALRGWCRHGFAGTAWARWWTGSRKARHRAQIVARGTGVFPNRSRPLCPYPQYAHYNGSGDPESAANFSCRQP